jgi:hypothetical protein
MITDRHQHTEHGSVLLNVLIAAVMFVALTFGVVSSYRVGGTTQDNEKDNIFAGQITQYPAMLKAAVLRISAGASNDTQICFDTPLWGHNHYQHGPALPDTQNVFKPTGGDVPFQQPDKDWLDSAHAAENLYGKWIFTGSTCVAGIGVGADNNCNVSDQSSDLVAILPYIRKGLCKEINRRVGVNRGNGHEAPQDIGNAWTASPEFDGDYTAGEVIGDAAEVLKGNDTGCFKGVGESYHFYATLMQR